MLLHLALPGVLAWSTPWVVHSPQGPFQAMTLESTGVTIPMAPLASDFDGDGDIDLAIGNGFLQLQPPTVSLLMNDGQGRFTAGPSLSGTGSLFRIPRTCVLADLQQDGAPEILIVYSDATLGLFPNAPVTGFQRALGYPAIVGSGTQLSGIVPTAQRIHDVTGDGYPEVLLALTEIRLFSTPLPLGITILRSDGTGTLTGTSTITFGNGQIGDFELKDVSGDGIDDLIGVDHYNHVYVAQGRQGGNFHTEVIVTTLPAASALADHLVAEDLDGDGDIDLAIGHSDTTTLHLLEQTAPLTFLTHALPLVTPSGSLRMLRARDMAGSGRVDLVTLEIENASGASIAAVYRQGGGMQFHCVGTSDAGYQSTPSSLGPPCGWIADFDGNATPDLIISNARTTVSDPLAIGILRNTADPPYVIRHEEVGAPGHLGVPTIDGVGPAVCGSHSFGVAVGGGPPLAPFLLMFSPWPQVVHADPVVRMLLVPVALEAGFLDTRGDTFVRTPIHSSSALHGEWAYAQAWILDPLANNSVSIAATERLAVQVGRRY